MVVPDAFVAAMPPMLASAPGSTVNQRPWPAAAALSALRRTPACTSAWRSAGRTASTRSSRERSSEIPPATGMTWPSSEVPAPNGVTGTDSAFAQASTRDTSAVDSG